jgi:hypothetical protein
MILNETYVTAIKKILSKAVFTLFLSEICFGVEICRCAMKELQWTWRIGTSGLQEINDCQVCCCVCEYPFWRFRLG